MTNQMVKDRPLEIFGPWQVEDYEPPVAKGGKVPRNEYGNVDLFKPCMLPRGCVHIPSKAGAYMRVWHTLRFEFALQ